MDKFDRQIAMLEPSTTPARLDERQFMKKLTLMRRATQVRRMLLALMVFVALTVIGGALRRNVWEVVALTVRYIGELPSMFTEYLNAYIATISWPSVISLVLLGVLGVMLLRSRRDVTAILRGGLYKPAVILGVLALALGIVGIFMGSGQATAHQEALKRGLNERGHLEVRVGNNDYELNAQSHASDDSIRNQAFIEELRNFDISRIYPELKDMNREGYVAEVRAVNTKDNCVFYVERRLEPALNQVMDASSACVSNRGDQVYYLDTQLKPVRAPKWKVGQAFYITHAKLQGAGSAAFGGFVNIVVLLEGKADSYVARSNSEKLVPKGQPGGRVQSCGINQQETCPQVGYIDIFTNAEGSMADGEIGSSVPGDSLKPRPGTEMARMFGKITMLNDQILHLETLSGKKLAIAWPRNIVQEFNMGGAKNYQLANGPLQIVGGDYLIVDISYKEGMDLQALQISDVRFIGLALKTTLPDPLQNEKYDKNKLPEKY